MAASTNHQHLRHEDATVVIRCAFQGIAEPSELEAAEMLAEAELASSMRSPWPLARHSRSVIVVRVREASDRDPWFVKAVLDRTDPCRGGVFIVRRCRPVVTRHVHQWTAGD
jgi:hypothetical protein